MFRFELNGIVVECDTAEELFSVMGPSHNCNKPKTTKNPQAASWAEAARVAEEKGITKLEARKLLAQQRKKKVPKKETGH